MKFYFLSVIIFSCIFISCASQKNIPEENSPEHLFDLHTDQLNKINIDGDLSEWNTNLSFKDSHSTLNTMIAADSSNIYIALLVNEEWLQMKILNMGMQVYFDTTNDKNLNHFISYPVMQQSAENENIFSEKNKPAKQNLINKAIILQTNGLNITADGMHQRNNEQSLKAALGTDVTGNLVYELSVSLKEIYGENFSEIVKKKSFLNIGFIINAFPKQNFAHNSSTINPSATTSPKNGQFNNSKTNYNLYNTQDMTSETKLWIKVKFE